MEIEDSTRESDLFVELLGLLCCIVPSDYPRDCPPIEAWRKFRINEMLSKHLIPGFSQDDVVMNVVRFISSLALDHDVANAIATTRVPELLHEMLRKNCSDDVDLTQEICFCFARLLENKKAANTLLFTSKIVPTVADLLSHENEGVRRYTD